MSIYVVVKARTTKIAEDAAQARGGVLRYASPSRDGMVTGICAEMGSLEGNRWLCEPPAAPPFPQGALLWWTAMELERAAKLFDVAIGSSIPQDAHLVTPKE